MNPQEPQIDTEYQLRFYGNGVSPTTIPVNELCEVLTAFDGAIKAVVESEGGNEKPALFLVAVENESLGLKTISNYASKSALAIGLIVGAIEGQAAGNIPEKAVKEIEKIVRFTNRHNCVGEINKISNGQKELLATIKQDTVFSYDASQTVRGSTSVFAYVEWAGGVNPRIHLLLPDESKLNCKTTKEVVQALKIYKWHTFSGDAEWESNTGKLVKFDITGVSFRPEDSAVKAFAAIAEKYGELFSNDVPDFSDEETL